MNPLPASLAYWMMTPDGPMAISSDLMGLWHDEGAKAVVFGTHAEAHAVWRGMVAAPVTTVPAVDLEAA